ncbi:MAG: pentapeptide repeat-containing protein [Rothia mucilaginosa]|uniref:pentapeptide repeat-containing protein n=1 Tax=Rothia mucilaginosa TaxID=43675 RepID=UPI0026EAFD42|nr:pentapeptide repeat-containing protein [Rothia mucilaginosa]MBS5102834.1 pentapeptide repeat-containing protein [Rothia mucilaginosa]
MRLDAIMAWSLLAIFTVLITLFLIATNKSEIKEKIPLISNWKVFYCWLGAIAFLGGITAFFLPIALNSGFSKGDDGPTLRQLLLYTTGGILGVITLGETHRKNNLEKDKFDEQKNQFEKQLISQKENLKEQLNSQLESQREQIAAQKEKDNQEYNRQVYSERRSRYTTAVEQLANENAAVRLGGIYTLAGLVDEWLTDKSLKEENDRRKEGQVIINSLCAYIRSPFPLAALRQDIDRYTRLTEGDIEKPNNNPRVIFLQEQEIRIAIFTEISKRLENSTNDHEDASGLWNKFKYNFREADIFYPLAELYFSSADFSGTKFYGNASFSSSKFIGDANFKFAVYEGVTSFLDVTFEGTANFYRATFAEKSSFAGASFNGGVDFNRLSYDQEPLFKDEIEGEIHQARFSHKTNPEEYKYTDKELEMKKIKTKDVEYENKTYTIPLEAVLYNPDNPSVSTVS